MDARACSLHRECAYSKQQDDRVTCGAVWARQHQFRHTVNQARLR